MNKTTALKNLNLEQVKAWRNEPERGRRRANMLSEARQRMF